MSDCLDIVQMEAVLDGGLRAEKAGSAKAHLASCEKCRSELEQLRGDRALLGEIQVALRGDEEREEEETWTHASSVRDAASLPLPEGSFEGFEILGEIHRGGQGVVYKALQKTTKRVVALKVLLAGPYASPKQRHRFEREVDLVASLNHPNIVTLFDSGVTKDNRHFFAMEYVEGAALDSFLAGKALTIPELLRLFGGICSAVSYAHQRGVIHRDLKPANICIDSHGQPQVLDFGLAKAEGPQRNDSGQTMTLAGEFMGTLAYASPEQAKGDPSQIDLRTDVYSLGVVLYEMLTGKRPYELTGSLAEDLRRIAETEPVRPSNVRSEIDDEVDTIILKTLAKDKERRYQSVAALADDVERYLADEPIEAKRDSRLYVLKKTLSHYRRQVVTGLAMLTLAFAAVGIGTHYWLKSERRAKADRFVRDAEPLLQERTRLAQAAQLLQQALDVCPDHENAYFQRGLLNAILGLDAPLEDKAYYLGEGIKACYEAHLAAGGLPLGAASGGETPSGRRKGMGRALLLAGKLSLLAGDREKAESYFALARTSAIGDGRVQIQVYDVTEDPLIDPTTSYADSPEAARQLPDMDAVLRWALRASVSSLDPRHASGTDDAIHTLLFDWFFRIELAQGQMIATPNPALIDGPIIKSDDQLTWKIAIRNDVQWHDGRELTVEDVVFSWQSVPERGTTVQSIEVIEGNAVRVVFSERASAVERELHFPLLPKHLADEWGADFNMRFGEKPVGTGPYRLGSESSFDHVVVERREDWTEVDSPAYFARVEFLVMPDRTERLQALADGRIDVVALSADEFRWTVNGESFHDHIRKIKHPQWAYEYICWNADGSNPFFTDPNVRRAMTYAMNLSGIVEGRFEGLYARSTGIHVEGSWMFDAGIEPFEQNAQLARQLLDAAGWELQSPSDAVRSRDRQRFEFSLLVPESALDFQSLAYDLQEDLRRVGVAMRVETAPWSQWKARRNAHDFQAFASRVRTGFHPNDAWERWATGTPQNYGGYSNPQVDELFETAQRELDATRQPEYHRRIQALIYRDQPYTFLWHTPTLLAVNKKLRGIQLGPLGVTRFSPGPRAWWFRAEAD